MSAMRFLVTVGLIAGGIYAVKRWQDANREAKEKDNWQAQQRAQKQQAQAAWEAWAQDRPLL